MVWASAQGAVSREVKYTETVISPLKFCCWAERAAALGPSSMLVAWNTEHTKLPAGSREDEFVSADVSVHPFAAIAALARLWGGSYP